MKKYYPEKKECQCLRCGEVKYKPFYQEQKQTYHWCSNCEFPTIHRRRVKMIKPCKTCIKGEYNRGRGIVLCNKDRTKFGTTIPPIVMPENGNCEEHKEMVKRNTTLLRLIPV